jgi:hypothetical protein
MMGSGGKTGGGNDTSYTDRLRAVIPCERTSRLLRKAAMLSLTTFPWSSLFGVSTAKIEKRRGYVGQKHRSGMRRLRFSEASS